MRIYFVQGLRFSGTYVGFPLICQLVIDHKGQDCVLEKLILVFPC